MSNPIKFDFREWREWLVSPVLVPVFFDLPIAAAFTLRW